jgi:hypothetical protein
MLYGSHCLTLTEVDALMVYNAFQQIWQKVMHMGGDYIEGM